MTVTEKRPFGEILTAYQSLLNGMQTSWPSSQTSIVIQQTTYTPATLITRIQSEMAPLQNVIAARSALRTAIDNRSAAMSDLEAFLNAVYAVLPQYIGATTDPTKFGKKPAKTRTPRTTEQQAAANAKAAATRAARHTMGKKQKLAIKGTVATTPTPAATTTTTTTTKS
jgi:hypothetical protein